MSSRAPLVPLALLVAATALGCQGPRWTQPLPALDRVPLSVWMSAGREVYAAGGPLGSGGEALLLRGDGASWQALPTATSDTLWWVFGLSATEVYAVGEHGTILHTDGASVTPLSSGTTTTLYGVWGSGAEDLWVVGGQPDSDGVILHRDGAGWHTMTPTENTGAYFKVWGAAANDVFICGQGGTILHWDGTRLTRQVSGLDVRTTLFTIAGRSGDDVWAVGGTGQAVVVHYDGQAWTRLIEPALVDRGGLSGVAVDEDGTALLVGEGGTKLRGRRGALVDESALDRVLTDLHGAAIRRGEAYAVGGNYVAPAPATRRGVVAHFGADVPSDLR